MKDPNCGYCARGELLDAFGIVICELSVSTLILFKEPSRPLHRRVQGSRQRDRQPHRRGAQRVHGRRGARGEGDSRHLPPG